MIEFTQLKVGDIKQALEQLGVTEQVKGKSEWTALAEKHGLTADKVCEMLNVVPPSLEFINKELSEDTSDDQSIFDQVELETESFYGVTTTTNKTTISTESKVPKYTDVEWHDFVLSQLKPEELLEGSYPKVEGLRRLAELLLGEIMFTGVVEFKSNSSLEQGDCGRCSCNYEIQIAWKRDVEPYVDLSNFEYPVKAFRGLASSCPGNTGGVYLKFPESIAEVRAEARALRKALNIRVVAAEELGDDVEDKPEPIQPAQVRWIKTRVNQLGLSLEELLLKFSLEKLEDATRDVAAQIIKSINIQQRNDEQCILKT